MYKPDLQALYDDCLLHCSIDETALHRVFDRLLLDGDFVAIYNPSPDTFFREELTSSIKEARKLLRGAILAPDNSVKKRLVASDRDAIFDAYQALPELPE